MAAEATVKDVWGDDVEVESTYDRTKDQAVVGLTVWEVDAHVTANLDREGVRKLRKALKRAARDLPK